MEYQKLKEQNSKLNRKIKHQKELIGAHARTIEFAQFLFNDLWKHNEQLQARVKELESKQAI